MDKIILRSGSRKEQAQRAKEAFDFYQEILPKRKAEGKLVKDILQEVADKFNYEDSKSIYGVISRFKKNNHKNLIP